MSGGGGKPRGGKMGTSIKDSISHEVLSSAEHELEMLESKLRGLRQSVNEARRRYQAAEAGCIRIELELDKCNKEVPLPCLSFCRQHYGACAFSFSAFFSVFYSLTRNKPLFFYKVRLILTSNSVVSSSQ
jgi:hypothetical protein